MKISLAGARRRALSALVCAASLLAACGGGAPIEPFVARRLIVLGDESSVLESNGAKYSVNALAADGVTLNCEANLLWVQILARVYGLTFGECPSGSAPTTALMRASADATVSSISAQIDAVGGFVAKDLVTLLVGANDILAQYALVVAGPRTEGEAGAVLKSAGEALAGQVNRIANTGGKVLISTVPDLGLTPFAIAEETLVAGRAALLTRLTQAFNDNLRNKIINDGRRIGLLLTDELVQSVVRNPAAAGLANATQAVCNPGLPRTGCTTLTLVTPAAPAASASASTYLWADDRLFSAGGHTLLGTQAASRAAGNPF